MTASLLSTFQQWQGMSPNFRVTPGTTPPVSAVLNAFVATMVKNGSSPAMYAQDDWETVIAYQLEEAGIEVDPDDVANLLESLGTWSGHLGVL